MDVKWDYKLSKEQRPNPVVYSTKVELPKKIIYPNEQHLKKVFKTDNFKPKVGRLKAWGRAKDKDGKVNYKDNPHWIAVRNGTPLHLDPPYPRYSHHLKIRVDAGIFVRGIDKVELMLETGTFYILDTHSPHQVFNKNIYDGWNVAISMDSDDIWDYTKAINKLTEFGLNNEFI